MTLRLVTLMSVVLLLSLAAFGLLMSQSQDRVMDEVARTASAVGQATLLELRGGLVGPHSERNVLVWRGNPAGEPGGRDVEFHELHRATARIVLAHDGESIERLEEIVAGLPSDETLTVTETIVTPGNHAEITVVGKGFGDLAPCVTRAELPGATGDGPTREFFISVEQITAKSDPARGLVLTIPRFTPAEATWVEDDAVNTFEYSFESEDGESKSLLARRDDIQLPIPVREYDELFSAIRGRSLFLFLGVFLVGTVLSTGLAAHFTRPIRKLDGAIRRLSDGDLDVSVPVQGRDEIGRLSRAFNEMARKLRANRERAREMVRREKLSALGRMAAGVAHDVRNPLHSIGLTLQHLSETSRPSGEERGGEFDRSVEIIRGEIRRLDGLIDNFLRFAKSERRERVPVDLRELLRETARLVHKEAERHRVDLKLEIDDATPHVPADPESLRSAILNLVLNSFEAMPDGGILTIRLASSENEVLLDVTDTCEGIPDEDRERVFEFAYTTRDGGNGLGLAMVHHCVVEEHGGRVSLESRAGEGTTVHIVLPVEERGSAA